MHINVLNYEPHLALFAPENDALAFYKAIARHAQQLLTPSGKIYLEINQYLSEETKEVFHRAGFNASVLEDFKGNKRFLIACRTVIEKE
jgi:release factor glutamine methyltransferase